MNVEAFVTLSIEFIVSLLLAIHSLNLFGVLLFGAIIPAMLLLSELFLRALHAQVEEDFPEPRGVIRLCVAGLGVNAAMMAGLRTVYRLTVGTLVKALH